MACMESSLTKCVDPYQTAPGSTLFASTLTLVNNASKCIQQTTSADDNFRYICVGTLMVKLIDNI